MPLYLIGNAISNNRNANDIASMVFVGSNTCFTVNDPPEQGDTIRVTATGVLNVPANLNQTATFSLWLPNSTGTLVGAVTATLPNLMSGALMPFWCQFLITFRRVVPANPPAAGSYNIEGNGVVVLGNGSLASNYALGPSPLNNEPLNVRGDVDVSVVFGAGAPAALTVIFDECTIEYLRPDVGAVVAPGDSCDDAGTIAMGLDYTFDIASGAQQWFMVPIISGTEYHCTLSINSGTIGSLNVSSGVSCDQATSQFTLSGSGCNSFTSSANGYLYVNVVASLMSGGNYTFTVATGPC
jgi:hypothetical protein